MKRTIILSVTLALLYGAPALAERSPNAPNPNALQHANLDKGKAFWKVHGAPAPELAASLPAAAAALGSLGLLFATRRRRSKDPNAGS